MVTALAFRRYRCFRDWQHVPVGRLHLVYGPNGAGKSSLVRLLPWLAASRVPGGLGLDFNWDGLNGASEREVIWRGDEPAAAEPQGMWAADPPWAEPDFAWAVGMGQACGTWGYRRRPNGDGARDLAWMEWSDRAVGAAAQLVPAAGAPAPLAPADWRGVRFDGVLPRATDAGLSAIVDRLTGVLEGVRWLGAHRRGPDRVGEVRGRRAPLGADGAGAQSHLLLDPGARERVSGWYFRHTGYVVATEAVGTERQRLVLQAPGRPPLAFADHGEGLQQVLPILAAAEAQRSSRGLLVVEEPESHLHPRLQAALIAQLAEVLNAAPTAQVMLETHSEALLLGALEAGLRYPGVEVRVSWVETGADGVGTVRDVPLGPALRPADDTLVHAFEVMGALRERVIQARRAHVGPH